MTVLLGSLVVSGAFPAAQALPTVLGSRPTGSPEAADPPQPIEVLGTHDPALHGDGLVWFIATFADGQVPSAPTILSAGLRELHRFHSIPALALAGPSAAFDRFLTTPGLRTVEHDRAIVLFLDTAVRATNAVDVWGDTWRPGYTNQERPKILIDTDGDGVPETVVDGRDVTVGVVDTGVNGLHPDLWYAPASVPDSPLRPKLLACVNLANAFSVSGTDGIDNPDCDQTVGHGTHVAGIVAGTGEASRQGLDPLNGGAPYVGVAPGASLVAAGFGVPAVGVVSVGASILFPAQGLDWMWEHREQYGIDVVTNSWGDAPACSANIPTSDAINQITNRLVDSGITVLFAAGNYGANPTFTSTYARNPKPGVIAVANYDDQNNGGANRRINSGSSDGCVAGSGGGNYLYSWPDVAAPGTAIIAAAAYSGMFTPVGQAPLFVGSSANGAPFYTSLTGTSMATPHVAGIVALMKQANPDLTPAQIERILIQTSRTWSDTITARGITGTTMWSSDASACFVSPADAAEAEAGTSPADLPGFAALASLTDADLYVCRDFKRGAGLVDAYEAVQAAIAFNDQPADPTLTITSPTAGATLEAGPVVVAGVADPLGSAANEDPVAQFTCTPDGLDVECDGSLSFDPDGSIAAFEWSWDDGTAVGDGNPASHSYAAAGTYAIRLTVTDDQGATGSLSLPITLSSGQTSKCQPDGNADLPPAPAPYDINGVCIQTEATGIAASMTMADMQAPEALACDENPVTYGFWFAGLASPFEVYCFLGVGAANWNSDDAFGTAAVAELDYATRTVTLHIPTAEMNGMTEPFEVYAESWNGPGAYGGRPMWLTGSIVGIPIFFDRAPDVGAVSLSGGDLWDRSDAMTTRPPPPAPPSDPQIQDGDPEIDDVEAGPFDIESAWFEADATDLYVGLKVAAFADPKEGNSYVIYNVNFKPDWTPTDPTWGGRVTGTEVLDGLRVQASLQPASIDGNLAPATATDFRFELQLLSHVTVQGQTTNNFEVLTPVPGTADASTGILWFPVARSALQSPPSGSSLVNTRADSGLSTAGLANFNQLDTAPSFSEFGAPFAFNDVLTADAGGPYAGTIDQPVALDGATAGGDGTATCHWTTSDDGTFEDASACDTTVAFASLGTKTVTLTATDGSGSASDNAVVVVSAEPGGERVELRVDSEPEPRAVVPVDTSAGAQPWSTEIVLDDGAHVLHASWYDAEGTLLDEAEVSVLVEGNDPPTATISAPASEKKNKPVAFDGSASSDPDGTIVSYAWDLGDGTSADTATVTHRYKDEGTYLVRLTVTDNEGATGTAEHTITIGKEK